MKIVAIIVVLSVLIAAILFYQHGVTPGIASGDTNGKKEKKDKKKDKKEKKSTSDGGATPLVIYPLR